MIKEYGREPCREAQSGAGLGRLNGTWALGITRRGYREDASL